MKKYNMTRFYRFWYGIIPPIAKLFYRVDLNGQEKQPPQGPYILCANHLSNLDPILIGSCLTSQLTFMGKKELLKVPLVGWFCRHLGMIPVDRGSGDISSAYAALHALKEDKIIALFPQGTRCPGVDPRETKLYHGAGMLVCRSQVPVVPVSVYTKNYKVKMFRKTYITFGDPIQPSEFHVEGKGVEKFASSSKLIFSRIMELDEQARNRAEGKKKA